MKKLLLSTPDVFVPATKGSISAIPLVMLEPKTFSSWEKKAGVTERQQVTQSGFAAKPGQVTLIYNTKGRLSEVLAGINTSTQVFDLAPAFDTLARQLSEKFLQSTCFKIEGTKDVGSLTRACVGWGLAGYRFEEYRDKKTSAFPRMVWPPGADKKSALAHIQAACMIRTLVNLPANDLGPDELEKAAQILAAAEDMTIKITRDKDLIKQNFPMIYAVGQGSPRRPRLIDLQWGNPKHPKITLVGKGVCFDTGGLDLKPPAAMLMMKKDMGGAAHALGLALLIVRHKLPVRLRVLIPAVENSVSGEAFRPLDVLKSRKGLSVEVGDTDAEGRLILGDALTLACEEKPDLLIDFATLTGAARVALGVDIPALFSNREKLAFDIKDVAEKQNDPLWPLPLWQPYRKEMASDIADISSTGSGKAGAITAALFLESFVDAKTDWVHIDLYAWDHGGKPGRSKGGTEMAIRGIFAWLEKNYSKKK